MKRNRRGEGGTALSLKFEIVSLRVEDWPEVSKIYSEGIATGNATFEATVPDWASWDATRNTTKIAGVWLATSREFSVGRQ